MDKNKSDFENLLETLKKFGGTLESSQDTNSIKRAVGRLMKGVRDIEDSRKNRVN